MDIKTALSLKPGDKVRCVKAGNGGGTGAGTFTKDRTYTIDDVERTPEYRNEKLDDWLIRVQSDTRVCWCNHEHFEPIARIGYYLGHGQPFNHRKADFTRGKAYELGELSPGGCYDVLGDNGEKWWVPADWFSDEPITTIVVDHRDFVDAIRSAYEGTGPAVTIAAKDDRPRADSIIDLLRKRNELYGDPLAKLVVFDDYSGHIEDTGGEWLYETNFSAKDGAKGIVNMLQRQIEEAK